ncbi:transposase domain protein [Phocaeicola vulgatus str. 3775 SR(B) 19]|nr:transposase domain protein [Phocaeicola vulgatus str. 3775 SR(B) 19]
MHVICNFTSRKMENVNTALFRGCLSLPAQKDRHHYDNNEPIF